MKSGTVSYAMHQALAAWTTKSRIDVHALAHGVSASGLYRALINAGKIAQKPRKAAAEGAAGAIPPQVPD